jgi:hypothetical protein
MTVRMRQNRLVSQHLEVALVYKEMLGIDEAKAYLLQENVPEHIAERVLCTGQKRNGFNRLCCIKPSLQPGWRAGKLSS